MADQPMNPLAGPAGPGPFTTRTDQLKFQSDAYGAGVENAANKAGAPLAKTPDVRGATNTEIRQAVDQTPLTPLFAPTQRPDEPITAGVPIGAGPGPEVLGIAPRGEKLSDALARMLPFDNTGEIAILYQQALARGN
ncbi:hypothetical protein EBZ38_09575 [bacterium]|nr:hypothetical protein [bacterium]